MAASVTVVVAGAVWAAKAYNVKCADPKCGFEGSVRFGGTKGRLWTDMLG